LLGEHAVVYGEPALAVPFPQLRTRVQITPQPGSKALVVESRELGRRFVFGDLASVPADLTARAIRTALEQTMLVLRRPLPEAEFLITSDIPLASGLGSGAATAVALVRAMAAWYDTELPPEAVSQAAYAAEVVHHGTPSGIDNTVIAYERAIYYERGQPIKLLDGLPAPCMIIASSGIASQTHTAVAAVRECLASQPQEIGRTLNAIGRVASSGLAAWHKGDWHTLASAMVTNQLLLQELGVSHPRLEALIKAAIGAGAWGAKLSGGGMGGCIIALAPPEAIIDIERALLKASATAVWHSGVPA